MIGNSVLILGGIIGLIPTVCMMFSSLFIFNVSVTPMFESTAQNFCAGLILGAVAKELFPQIGNLNDKDNLLGITTGFMIGLFILNFLGYFLEKLESGADFLSMLTFGKESSSTLHPEHKTISESEINFLNNNMVKKQVSYQSIEIGESDLEDRMSIDEHESAISESDSNPLLILASEAISSPLHRDRIKRHIREVTDSIYSLENKSKILYTMVQKKLPNYQLESIADSFDEEVHQLHYYIDHCRRLFLGSESNTEGVIPRLLITERSHKSLMIRLEELKIQANYLNSFLDKEDFSKNDLAQLHRRINTMDQYATQLHRTIEGYTFRWGRRRRLTNATPIPTTGSTVSISLILPVIIDCLVDGFLLGTTSSISLHAGAILCFANSIEMGFLGLAISIRVQKCTGSSLFVRYLSLIVPPLLMFVAAIAGSYGGSMAATHPFAYVSFISFAIVALLYLVVNELIVEAKEAIEGQEQWWTAMVLFIGIYVVLLMDILLPI